MKLWKTGIVSVTFRQLSPTEILSLVKKAGLDGIEWGSDIHVPAGELSHAKKVGELTKKQGLEVFSYGTYYRIGEKQDYLPAFRNYLDTALALGTSHMRVWAGIQDSEKYTEEQYSACVAEAQKVADISNQYGIHLSCECHGGSLTNRPSASLRFVREVNRDNFHLYWQPNQFESVDYNKKGLSLTLPYVTNLHVFTWNAQQRFPMKEGKEIWAEYMKLLSGGRHNFLLEFVLQDDPKQFLEDAQVLKELLEENRS